MLDIGSCNLHIVHNAFRKGLEAFGADVGDMVITVNAFFDGWPSRQEAFLDAQIKVNVPQHCFVKHITSRWLTLSTAAKRLQEQWPALEQFFLQDIPKSGTPNIKKIAQTAQYKNISNHLKNSFMKAEVSFVIESAAIFERFLLIFQKDEPLIHILFEEVMELTATVLGRVCKPDVLLDLNNLNSHFISNNLLPTNQIKCGDNTEKIILKMKDLDQLQFKTNVRDHFIAAASHLLNKTIIASSATTKHFKCLKPEERKEEKSIRSITKIARLLPFKVSETALSDEWLLLQLDSNLITISNNPSRIDCYWKTIFNIKNALNECKYPLITKVVKAVLSLSHGSASVERYFSISGQIITPDKVRMKVKTLNAKLNIKSALRAYGGKAELVPITRELITEANFAYSKYKSHLEEEKRTAEKEIEKKEIEQEKKRNQLLKEQLDKSQKDIKILEDEYKEAKKNEISQKNVAEKMIEEASLRLKNAVKKKEFNEIQIAQAMLEGAHTLHKEYKLKEEASALIQKKIEKRKSNLISSFIEKKRRKD